MAFRQTVNLGNSIIGVSILTMPYCFKKCGILLGVCLIILSGFLNRAGCHLLLRSAIITRKRSYELMAYDVFGPKGKLVVEIGILGFLIGTCVAFFVVIGDLGPAIVSQALDIPNGPLLRAFIMTFLGMFIALPLGLLRRIDSLSSFSALSLGLYTLLITKLFFEASANLMTATEKQLETKINWWDWNGAFSNLPIFAMALSCQTQLFEVFDYTVLNFEDYNSLKKLNKVVKQAINLCSFVYIMVGILGYIAFYEDPFQGNILLFLPSGFSSVLTKLGFIFTVVISLPICLFPCRTSLHSLLFRKGTGSLLNEPSATAVYMSDHDFKLLTVLLIVTTIGISVIVPRIEVVLGIIGSTIGAIICFILPGLIYTNVTTKNTTERIMARAVTYIGFFVLIFCSFSTIRDAQAPTATEIILKNLEAKPPLPPLLVDKPFIEGPEHNLDQFPKSVLPVESADLSQHQPSRPKSNGKPSGVPIILQVPRQQLPIAIDPAKVKKQEEILLRLENQQKEHKKLLEQQKQLFEQMKKHEEGHQAAVVPAKHDDDSHKAIIPEVPPEKKETVLKQDDIKPLKAEDHEPQKSNAVPVNAEKMRVVEKVKQVETVQKQIQDQPIVQRQQKIEQVLPAVVVDSESKVEPVVPKEPIPIARRGPIKNNVQGAVPAKAIAEPSKVAAKKNFSADVQKNAKSDSLDSEKLREPKRDTLSIGGEFVS